MFSSILLHHSSSLSAPNPEDGLTLTSSWTQGVYSEDVFRGTEDAVIAIDGIIPASPSGCIWATGNQFRGSYAGFRANGDFVVRGGQSGDSAPSASGTDSLALILSSGQPFGSGTLVIEFKDPSASLGAPTLRAWWNGVLIGTATTVGGGSLSENEWTRLSPTWYFNVTNAGGSGVGEENTALPLSGSVALRYYQNQLSAL